MGVGDPLEAAYPLNRPIAAGSWQLVGDGAILAAVDMQFDVVWRSDGKEQVIVSWQHHFDVAPEDAVVPFDGAADGAAVPAAAGDLLVLRMTANQSTATGAVYVPNGEGSHANGRIPSLTLP